MSELQDKPFKVLVVGGTGRVGSEVIRTALGEGYQVRAITRDMKKAKNFNEGPVEWQQCDATNKECMLKAVEGRDAVISTIGHDNRGPTMVYTDSAKTMIEAMKEQQIKRIISVTCFWNYPRHNFFFKFLTCRLLKNVRKNQEEMIQWYKKRKNDEIKWTVVRSFSLKDNVEYRYMKAGTHEEAPWLTHTNIKDLAGFLVTEAKLTFFLWDFPIAGYTIGN
jgi:nucleoside-diphosphate-sugar epimerase